ncbi:unnamed protein product, partial [Candidula unifasciata]
EEEPNGLSLPFQVIVKYRTLAGAEVVRVWTSERKITKDRAQAEGAMNAKTVIENFLQQSSQQMLDEIFAKKMLVEQANAFSNSGQDLLKDYGVTAVVETLLRVMQLLKLKNNCSLHVGHLVYNFLENMKDSYRFSCKPSIPLLLGEKDNCR